MFFCLGLAVAPAAVPSPPAAASCRVMDSRVVRLGKKKKRTIEQSNVTYFLISLSPSLVFFPHLSVLYTYSYCSGQIVPPPPAPPSRVMDDGRPGRRPTWLRRIR